MRNDVKGRIDRDELLLDSAIVAHGYAGHLRDNEVVIEVPAAKQDGSGESEIAGSYRYVFTHCVEAHVTTNVGDDVWRESWVDHFTDWAAWEAAGSPDGFVWGVRYADAYPGLSYVADSALARSWSDRLGQAMHEVAIETNTFVLRLVFHDYFIQEGVVLRTE